MNTCIVCSRPSPRMIRGLCPKHYKETMAKIKRGKTTEEAEVKAGNLLPDNSLAKNDALFAKMNPGKVFKRRGRPAGSVSKVPQPRDESAIDLRPVGNAYTYQRCGGGRRVLRGGYSE